VADDVSPYHLFADILWRNLIILIDLSVACLLNHGPRWLKSS
jgi:hypothetical protein